MKVSQAEFVISAVGPDQYPTDGIPEIALAGRSNVGKSSLLNKMMVRKNLARTSAKPGKTQTLNYYLVNESFYFVDFPGYGYAKVSKLLRERWGQMIEAYLLNRSSLKLVLLVVDLRHPPSKDDQMMFEWLHHFDLPCRVIATKADKVPKTRWPKHLKAVRETLGMAEGDAPILFSSEKGIGVDSLWSCIAEFL